jgi:Sulfotransferase family
VLTHTFICGCGHSGTSLLANMFASHPEVFIPLRESETFLEPEQSARNWEALAAEAAMSGKRHFAEKTPRHIRALATIRALVPGARFIVMVRDGRDVAASFIRRKGSAAFGLRRWLRDSQVALREAEAADVRLLRYEDLVVGPEAALREVCAFADLPFAPEMLRFHETRRLWFGVESLVKGSGENGEQHRLLRNWQVNQPIFDGRGQWRALLAPEDLALFEKPRVAAMMAEFGYA